MRREMDDGRLERAAHAVHAGHNQRAREAIGRVDRAQVNVYCRLYFSTREVSRFTTSPMVNVRPLRTSYWSSSVSCPLVRRK